MHGIPVCALITCPYICPVIRTKKKVHCRHQKGPEQCLRPGFTLSDAISQHLQDKPVIIKKVLFCTHTNRNACPNTAIALNENSTLKIIIIQFWYISVRGLNILKMWYKGQRSVGIRPSL